MPKPQNMTQKLAQIWRWPLIFVMLFAGGYGVKTSGVLSPGPVTAQHRENEPLNGYVSHADFEQECMHCHTPVHCVSDDRCQQCHLDIARQRTEGFGLHSLMPGTEKCQTCHADHKGHQTSITEMALRNIDHSLMTGFSLELHTQDYAGNPLDCKSCHSQDSFASKTLDCITCHVEADHDFMAAHIEEFGYGCVDCHDGKDRMRDFDHTPIYPLDGSHLDLACADCHLDKNYHTTPNRCIDCHPEPEMHAGIFGQECERCHTSTAWAPAQLLKHTFLLDHDTTAEGIETCETCHAGSYTQYPCYNCHTLQEMETAHAGENISNLDDCLSCHPTGRGVVENPDNQGFLSEFLARLAP